MSMGTTKQNCCLLMLSRDLAQDTRARTIAVTDRVDMNPLRVTRNAEATQENDTLPRHLTEKKIIDPLDPHQEGPIEVDSAQGVREA